MRFCSYLLLFLNSLCFSQLPAQIDPERITIARDEYGVPHIFAPTDPEAAYGLAWVQCEDQFEILQQTLMLVRERLGREYGKTGAAGDFFSALFQLDQLVEERYDRDVSLEFKAYLRAYCQGVNDFAEQYPEEVLDKKIFPVMPQDLLEAYPLKITDFIGGGDIVSRLVNGDYYDQRMPDMDYGSKGSNSFAFRSTMTKDGRTYLICNPHLDFEGLESFYEVQVMSEEGWHFQGAMFPGSLGPQIGTNEHLGWTHTNNYYDHTDVYALKMHPTEKLLYEYDGEWRELEKRKIKLKVKLKWLPFPIGVKRTVYESVYGPTLQTPEGNFFAIRTPPAMTIKTAEQWYRMSKAQNLEEFQEALAIDGLPYFNITYADKEDNIFYLCNGLFPDRTPGYDYAGVVPGNTSETRWQRFLPMEERPLILNPDCGYVYNVNHNPFKCTCEESWLDSLDYQAEVDFQQTDDNVRSYQWRQIYQDGTFLDMEELRALKFDARMPERTGLHTLLERYRRTDPVSGTEYIVDSLKAWDGVVNPEGNAATYMLLGWFLLEGAGKTPKEIADTAYEAALVSVHDHLMEYFGTTDVPYKTFFRFKRGDKNLPIFGFPATLAARFGGISKEDGRYYAKGGDGFMMFIQYNERGVVDMESIVAYGASTEPESPYYNNQMELFAEKKAKPQTFDKDAIMKQAARVYHPGK